MSDKTYNVNISGGNNQNAFGDHSSFVMTNEAGVAIDLDAVFRAILDGVPEPDRPAMEQEAIVPLRELAAADPPANEQDRQTLMARVMEYASHLEPYVPYIRRTLAAFAEGALSTLPPPASWVMGGIMEVVRDHRR